MATLALIAAPAAAAETFTVTNNADSGAGSLRQAITSSDAAAPGPNKIDFTFVGEEAIDLTNSLPEITTPLTIEGATSSMATPLAIIDGAGLTGTENCLTVGKEAKKTTIYNLSVVGCPGAGIALESKETTLEGNYLGIKPGGTVEANGTGLYIGQASSGNSVGNITAPNVISGNGIGVNDWGSNNTYTGNRIGTNLAGTAKAGNGLGMKLEASADSLFDNLISGNKGDGADVIGGTGNNFGANMIGTTLSGDAPLGNGGNGLTFSEDANNNFIGGTDLASGPVIASNGGDGLWFVGSGGNVIYSASIGVGADGTTKLGNGGNGINIEGGSPTTVGFGGSPIVDANNAGFGVISNVPAIVPGENLSVFGDAHGGLSLVAPSGLSSNGLLGISSNLGTTSFLASPFTTVSGTLFSSQSGCDDAQTSVAQADGSAGASGSGSLSYSLTGTPANPSQLLTNGAGTTFSCLTLEQPKTPPSGQPNPTPVSPPEPKPCACATLTAFLNHFITSQASGSTRIEFDLNWTMTCSSGTGDCNGSIKVLAPSGASFIEQDGKLFPPKNHPKIVTIGCPGPCTKTITGKESLAYFALLDVKDKGGRTHTVPNPRFTSKGRAGKRFELRLSLLCSSAVGKVVKLHVAFDKHGQVDYKESLLLTPGALLQNP